MNAILSYLTVADAAKRVGVCKVQLARAIVKAGLKPDAVLIEDETRLRTRLIEKRNLPKLARLIHTEPDLLA
jgi:hypothetical protein